ncbi:MAG: zinc-binding dehydrogenase [Armatimonadetes bacterium]|nr:zinc-binding dehydrogenase [Armatimonadota bacterium]
MGTVRAAVLRNGQFTVEDLELVVPPGAIELEVAACGICGSDLRYAEGEDAWAAHTLGEPRTLPDAMVLGHEIAAWRHGPDGRQLVAVIPFFTCGRCEHCRSGRPNLCRFTVHHGHGQLSSAALLMFPGFAEKTCAFPFQLLPAAPGISPEELTLLDGLAVAVHALKHARVSRGQSVAVFGAGPIGLSVVQAARCLGCANVAAVDIDPAAIARAEKLGASIAFLFSDDGISARLLGEARRGFDAVFDTTGSADAQRLALDVLARGGTAVFMAGLASGLELKAADLAGEKQITSSCNCMPEDYIVGLQWMASGAFNARALVTHVVPLENIETGFQLARNKSATGACKVVVRPSANGSQAG